MMCHPEATKENIDESDYVEIKQFSTAKLIINNIRRHIARKKIYNSYYRQVEFL